jgi:carbon storage regulator
MLVLSRKIDQEILIGEDIVVTVISVNGNRVKLGIEAPKDVRILREKINPFVSEQWDGEGLDVSNVGGELEALGDAAFSAR